MHCDLFPWGIDDLAPAGVEGDLEKIFEKKGTDQ